MLDEEEECPMPWLAIPDTNSHFAIGGKSFSVVLDHFPDLLPKVGLHRWSRIQKGPRARPAGLLVGAAGYGCFLGPSKLSLSPSAPLP